MQELPIEKFGHGMKCTVTFNKKKEVFRIGKQLAAVITSMDAKEFFLASQEERAVEFAAWLHREMLCTMVLNATYGDVYIIEMRANNFQKRVGSCNMEYATPSKLPTPGPAAAGRSELVATDLQQAFNSNATIQSDDANIPPATAVDTSSSLEAPSVPEAVVQAAQDEDERHEQAADEAVQNGDRDGTQ